MKRVFILNGCAESGKNTFVDMMNEIDGISAIHYSYVDFARDMLKGFNIPVNDKTDKMRKLLCDVNNSLEEYADIPFRDCVEFAKEFKKLTPDEKIELLFIDCREPKKIERLKQELNAKTILVVNDRVKSVSTNNADKEVNTQYNYDFYVMNNGNLEDLKCTAEALYKLLKEDYEREEAYKKRVLALQKILENL